MTSSTDLAGHDEYRINVIRDRVACPRVGAVDLEGAGRLGTGDAVRLTGAGSPGLTAGPDGAEVRLWIERRLLGRSRYWWCRRRRMGHREILGASRRSYGRDSPARTEQA